MMGYCKVDGCSRPVENRDTGLCATHSKALRKIVKPPIKRVADKLKKDLDAYTEAKRAFLHGKRCAVYPSQKASEIHHMMGRIGKLLMDQRYWLPVCRTAHVKITTDSKWAISMGYSIPRNQKQSI